MRTKATAGLKFLESGEQLIKMCHVSKIGPSLDLKSPPSPSSRCHRLETFWASSESLNSKSRASNGSWTESRDGSPSRDMNPPEVRSASTSGEAWEARTRVGFTGTKMATSVPSAPARSYTIFTPLTMALSLLLCYSTVSKKYELGNSIQFTFMLRRVLPPMSQTRDLS